MKKKLWCVLCIMICMMMIAACGQKKNPEKKKSEKAEQEETEFKDRESLKLSLFTVYYPKAWNYDKENMKKDEEYSYVRFFDGDTADGSENVISIEATKEDSYTYRKSLIAFGVDLEAYAEGKIWHASPRHWDIPRALPSSISLQGRRRAISVTIF